MKSQSGAIRNTLPFGLHTACGTKSACMENVDERQKRAHEAGIRLAITETEVATALLTKMAVLSDPKERNKALKEARATLDLASRLIRTMPFPDPRCDEIGKVVQSRRERLNQLTAAFPETRHLRSRAAGRSL